MTRKLLLISSLILIAIASGALIWIYSAQSSSADSSGKDHAIRETIQRAWRIQLEAQYTFNTSQYATVFINDPRAGEITDESLALIREIRQDPTLRKDQVGLLDSKKAAIENLKREYENWMAELRAREAAGTINNVDRLILEGETYGWPMPDPALETAQAAPKPTRCVYPTAEATFAYPEPDSEPQPISIACEPTPTPAPATYVNVPYRGRDPATLSPEDLAIEIISIQIEGDIARAVVHKSPITSEYVLVKVDGQWYIAGGKLLKSSF